MLKIYEFMRCETITNDERLVGCRAMLSLRFGLRGSDINNLRVLDVCLKDYLGHRPIMIGRRLWKHRGRMTKVQVPIGSIIIDPCLTYLYDCVLWAIQDATRSGRYYIFHREIRPIDHIILPVDRHQYLGKQVDAIMSRCICVLNGLVPELGVGFRRIRSSVISSTPCEHHGALQRFLNLSSDTFQDIYFRCSSSNISAWQDKVSQDLATAAEEAGHLVARTPRIGPSRQWSDVVADLSDSSYDDNEPLLEF